MEPLFTTKPELERSGMGFAFMEAFMDELEVESIPGKHESTYVEENALRRLDRKRGLRHGRSISTHRKVTKRR